MARNGSDNLVNHTVKNLVEGVSEQINEARRETQVDEMINCVPNISRGVMRRNPTKSIGKFKKADNSEIDNENFYIYSYDTNEEQYTILIGNKEWYAFDNNGNNVGQNTLVNYLNTNGKNPNEVFSLITVGDYTFLNNSEKIVSNGDVVLPDTIKNNYLRNAFIWIKKTDNKIVKNYSSGNVRIKGLKYKVELGDLSKSVTAINVNRPEDNDFFKPCYNTGNRNINELMYTYQIALEMGCKLGDDIINNINTSVTRFNIGNYVETSEEYDNLYSDVSFIERKYDSHGTLVYIRNIFNGQIVKDNGQIKYTDGGYHHENLNGAGGTKYKYNRIIKIEYDEDYSCQGDTKGWRVSEDFIYHNYNCLNIDNDLFVSDGLSGNAILGVKGIVKDSSYLPAKMPKNLKGFLVKVDNNIDEDTGSEYWLRWDGSSWVESKNDGLKDSIDERTMPHVFKRNSNGIITFGYYGQYDIDTNYLSKWDERLVGDEDSAPMPSFVGNKITSIFFHNNRLGILSNDNVIMSELGVFGNFFPTTVRTVLDTDPIDITVATTDVTILKKAVSISGSLLMFSETSQFILSASGQNLTPETAIVNKVSSYNYSTKAPATVIGNKIFFTAKSGNGTQLFDFELNTVISSNSQNVAANNRSLHIPTYLPNNIEKIVGHSVLGFIFMFSRENPYNIYVLNTTTIDKQTAQSAFHKWEFKDKIIGINIVQNNLNIVFLRNGGLENSYIELDTPRNMENIIYADENSDNLLIDYNSMVRLSKWQIKDGNGIGIIRGRLQIRTAKFSISDNSQYTVNIVNDSLITSNTGPSWILSSSYWNDNLAWEDNGRWSDGVEYKARVYHNDDKISILSNSANTYIVFKNNENNKRKGFELALINLEGMFRQRSTRY